jgi:excinuclease ABC subunit A
MIIAQGTPEDVAANPASHTGRFLAPMLARDTALRRAPSKPAARKSRKKTA